jgi:hypothetical protein
MAYVESDLEHTEDCPRIHAGFHVLESGKDLPGYLSNG